MTMGARYLVVRLAGREFAVPASRICGMVQMRGLEVQELAGFGAMRYLASLHGRALPVFVPNGVLGVEDRPVSARSCLLLIRGGEKAVAAGEEQLDAGAAHCAMLVDSISRLEEIPAQFRRPSECVSDAEKASGGEKTGEKAWSREKVRLGEKWRDVIDVDLIFQCRNQAVLSPMT
jgi:hypothetical protein